MLIQWFDQNLKMTRCPLYPPAARYFSYSEGNDVKQAALERHVKRQIQL